MTTTRGGHAASSGVEPRRFRWWWPQPLFAPALVLALALALALTLTLTHAASRSRSRSHSRSRPTRVSFSPLPLSFQSVVRSSFERGGWFARSSSGSRFRSLRDGPLPTRTSESTAIRSPCRRSAPVERRWRSTFPVGERDRLRDIPCPPRQSGQRPLRNLESLDDGSVRVRSASVEPETGLRAMPVTAKRGNRGLSFAFEPRSRHSGCHCSSDIVGSINGDSTLVGPVAEESGNIAETIRRDYV